jgi:hypothetical protein
MCRTIPAMSESAKNASGQEVFGHKGGKTQVEQSPVTSAADVSSQALGAGGGGVGGGEGRRRGGSVDWRSPIRPMHARPTTNA